MVDEMEHPRNFPWEQLEDRETFRRKEWTRRICDGLSVYKPDTNEVDEDRRLEVVRDRFVAARADSVDEFLASASRVLSLSAGQSDPPIVLREEDRGTVSSSLVALADDPSRSVYLYADGAPDRTAHDDYSELLRRALGSR